MSLHRLREFLDSHDIQYVVISHSVAYTAQGIAALTHIPGKKLAKTVVTKIDGRFAMAVVPASRQVDLALLRAATRSNTVELASRTSSAIAKPAPCRPSEISMTWPCSPTRVWPVTK